MSTGTQSEPVMDGSDDASEAEKKAGIAQQVAHDHGTDDSPAHDEELRQRIDEADVETTGAAGE